MVRYWLRLFIVTVICGFFTFPIFAATTSAPVMLGSHTSYLSLIVKAPDSTPTESPTPSAPTASPTTITISPTPTPTVTANPSPTVIPTSTPSGSTVRVSISTSGSQGNSDSFVPSISSNGRYIAFSSWASNLVNGDTNGTSDIFVRDRQTGATSRVSLLSSNSQMSSTSTDPAISSDGRYVAFSSKSYNGWSRIYVRDRSSGSTSTISVASGGAEADGNSFMPSVSSDGRYVAFESLASNLVNGDTNDNEDVFVRDRETATTLLVSVSRYGTPANGDSGLATISANGRYVAFTSRASNLVAGDTNGVDDIFVRDLLTGITTRVSVSSIGTQSNSFSQSPSISANGRFVTFSSDASNLVDESTSGEDIFVHDRQTGDTTIVSVSSVGEEGAGQSIRPSISPDGRYIAFSSTANNLVPNDNNYLSDIFVHDRLTGNTRRISVSSAGTQQNSAANDASISTDGRHIAFASDSTNLVSGDNNDAFDIFLHERITD